MHCFVQIYENNEKRKPYYVHVDAAPDVTGV